MDTPTCPRFEKAMEIISKRWSGLIIHQLLNETKRFNELEHAMGISARVLSERLKELEEEGIIQRDVFAETPVRIQYSLTEKGQALEPIIRSLEKWGSDWVDLV